MGFACKMKGIFVVTLYLLLLANDVQEEAGCCSNIVFNQFTKRFFNLEDQGCPIQKVNLGLIFLKLNLN